MNTHTFAGVMILMDVSDGEGRSAIERMVFKPSSSSSFYDAVRLGPFS